MSFMELMKETNNKRKTLTENGATAYATAGREILDFNFRLSSYRKMETEDIMDEYARVYFEDPLTAVKFLFWVGDVREGAGERKSFRAGLSWLAENKPEVMRKLIPLVAEYNRFDSLLPLLDTNLRKDVSSYYKRQLEDDLVAMEAKQKITLAGKWCPSENATSPETRRRARMLREDFGCSSKKYRKTLSALRSYSNVVEVKMSAKEWSKIDYNIVPSKANLIYSEAFSRNDTERRFKYLESLKKGEAKINAGVLQPHEIVANYAGGGGSWKGYLKEYDETLEQLWENLPNVKINNMLVVRDGSGSMLSFISGKTACLDVATALAIYMAERNTGGWKDKFVTFSRNPEIVDISNCQTLHDKIELAWKFADCSNTDIYKTMMLILTTAVENHIPQSEMPDSICICSDMQFDGYLFHLNDNLFERIIEEFEDNGYKMPKLIFWNINDRRRRTVPLQTNDMGLILCSGFSVQIMNLFFSNKLDPYEILMEKISTERYKIVEEAVKDII